MYTYIYLPTYLSTYIIFSYALSAMRPHPAAGAGAATRYLYVYIYTYIQTYRYTYTIYVYIVSKRALRYAPPPSNRGKSGDEVSVCIYTHTYIHIDTHILDIYISFLSVLSAMLPHPAARTKAATRYLYVYIYTYMHTYRYTYTIYLYIYISFLSVLSAMLPHPAARARAATRPRRCSAPTAKTFVPSRLTCSASSAQYRREQGPPHHGLG